MSQSVNPNQIDNEKISVPMDDKMLAPSDDKMVAPVKDDKMVVHPSDKIVTLASSEGKISVAGEGSTSICQKFEVLKSSDSGLVMPENLQLAITQIEPTPATSQPVFMTSEMNWMDIMTALPPWFELAGVGSSNNAHLIKPVATVCPRGVQGITGITVDIRLQEPKSQGLAPPAWQVKRSGFLSRTYKMIPASESSLPSFIWKGSSRSTGIVNDANPKRKGNLKLITGDDKRILAVWKQHRDSQLLGSINIFEGATELISTEGIIASCLCCVMAERATGMNWVGGLGK